MSIVKRVPLVQRLIIKGTQLLLALLLGAAGALSQTYTMHKDVESAIVWQRDCYYEKLGSSNFDVDKYMSHTPTCAAEMLLPDGAVASIVLMACRSEFITADAAGGVGVFPLDRPSVGGVGVDVAAEFAS